jgi:hypothetical protein
MYRETEDAQNELAAAAKVNQISADGPTRRAAKRADLEAKLAEMAAR